MWKCARICICVAGAVAGAVKTDLIPTEMMAGMEALQPLLVVLGVFGVIAMPAMLLGVIGIQAVNPLSRTTWVRPSWRSKFLDVRDPLHFFHMAGWCVMAAGIGRILVAAVWAYGPLWLGLLWVMGGISALCGVRLCMFVYRGKYRPETVGHADNGAGSQEDDG